MMKKLAVTVFVMSLTLVGCGSSSTTKVDAGGSAKLDASMVDVAVTPTPEAGQPDVVKSPDVTPPGQPDAGVDTTIVPPVDAAPDTTAVTDVSTTVLDGGTDVVVLKDTGSATTDASHDTTGTTHADAGPDGTSVLHDGSAIRGEVGVVNSPDASEAGSDVGAIMTGDASEEVGSTVDAPGSTVDAPESDAVAEVEAGSTAADGGGDDSSTD
jgi:hypothetical protein